MMLYKRIQSPVGPLLLAADEGGLRLIEFVEPRHPMARVDAWRQGDSDILTQAHVQLDEYFAGTRRAFDLPLAPVGTEFQRTVWSALAQIPYGATISYAQLADSIGRPTATRAVGAANGRNPLPIVLPCHRVIGADGSLTGFGGGLPTKQFLLQLEGALPDAAPDLFDTTARIKPAHTTRRSIKKNQEMRAMTPDLHARFVALHHGDAPLLLANAWDAASARLWQEAGAPAVATSSAAVAWSRGYPDGGGLPRQELLASLRGMVRVTSVPVTVDFEDGYSDDPEAVAALAAEVVECGAVGINIEDGGGSPDLLVAKIKAIRRVLDGRALYINARTDAYIRGMASGAAAVAMTIERLNAYCEAGADGGFVPGLLAVDEARAISAAVPLAINVMAMPGLPAPDVLAAAGVCRISGGPSLFKTAFGAGDHACREFLRGNFAPGFDNVMDYGALNRMFAAE